MERRWGPLINSNPGLLNGVIFCKVKHWSLVNNPKPLLTDCTCTSITLLAPISYTTDKKCRWWTGKQTSYIIFIAQDCCWSKIPGAVPCTFICSIRPMPYVNQSNLYQTEKYTGKMAYVYGIGRSWMDPKFSIIWKWRPLCKAYIITWTAQLSWYYRYLIDT